jgi:alpha-1,2-mannosyltransferase
MILGLEALLRRPADVFIDTTGFAFTLPLAALSGAKVAAYVHYPTISTDMLSRVQERRPSHNNDAAIAGSSSAR